MEAYQHEQAARHELVETAVTGIRSARQVNQSDAAIDAIARNLAVPGMDHVTIELLIEIFKQTVAQPDPTA